MYLRNVYLVLAMLLGGVCIQLWGGGDIPLIADNRYLHSKMQQHQQGIVGNLEACFKAGATALQQPVARAI